MVGHKAKFGMSVEKIKEKLKSFDGNDAKHHYLEKLNSRRYLLFNPRTRKNFDEVFGDLSAKMKYWAEAAYHYEAAGEEELAHKYFSKAGYELIHDLNGLFGLSVVKYWNAYKQVSEHQSYNPADDHLRDAENYFRKGKDANGLALLAKFFNRMADRDHATDLYLLAGKMKNQEKRKGIEKTVMGIGAVTGFVFSLYFLSSNLTGNTIGTLGSASNNAVGIMVFFASLILAFIAVRS